ncbi:MAG TPA: alpha/beta hydrolase [Acidimicrobiia bacterium]|nr:alpha/beta hydrolase [Acidimicrobiia bacterium]
MSIAALDWGGAGEPLLLLHPNGFCAGFFDPLARRLRDRYRPIAVDLRGHGASETRAERDWYRYDWMAADVAAVLDELGVGEFVALGESLGGGVATYVDRLRAPAMRRVMLCEAIAFDLPGEATRAAEADAGGHKNFMAEIARKRRPVWTDRATVRASYGSRAPLDVLAPEFLDAYVHWGFRDRPDGQVELACPPEVEATIFEIAADPHGAIGAWSNLAGLSATAVVLCGDRSDLPMPWFEAQAARAGAELVVVPGGHFFLQEDLDRAEALVRRYLA